jgi:hypothetical protein
MYYSALLALLSLARLFTLLLGTQDWTYLSRLGWVEEDELRFTSPVWAQQQISSHVMSE